MMETVELLKPTRIEGDVDIFFAGVGRAAFRIQHTGDDAGAPLRWLLASQGVRLPAKQGQASAPRASGGSHRPDGTHRVRTMQEQTAKARP